MYLVVAALVCLEAVSASPIHHHEIHKRMTPVEVQQVFGTSHVDVPEYELVNVEISRIQKRSSSGTRLKIDVNKQPMYFVVSPINGYLVSNDTPVTWLTIDGPEGFEFTDHSNIMDHIEAMMESPKTSSLFIFSRNRNRRDVVNGYIGTKDLVIRSLPERLDESSVNGSRPHIIFKMKSPLPDSLTRSIRDNTRQKKTREDDFLNVPYRHPVPTLLESLNKKSAPPVLPAIIYPKVLVAVDPGSFAQHGWSIENVIIYHLILWHSVNMRFKTLTRPDVRISISRFVIALTLDAMPFIRDSEVSTDHIDSFITIDNAQSFWYEQMSKIPNPSFDAVMIFARKQLLTIDSESWTEPPFAVSRGIAVFASMCEVDENTKKFGAVSLINDKGDLDSLVVAHELGHLLGMDHDPISGKRNAHGKQKCAVQDNYVMAQVAPANLRDEVTLNYWRFSECSIENLRADLHKYNRSCLLDRPQTRGTIVPEISGYLLMADPEPCPNLHGPDAFTCSYLGVPASDVCTALYCHVPGGQCVKTDIIPLDGTSCGDHDRICEMGKCVSPYSEQPRERRMSEA